MTSPKKVLMLHTGGTLGMSGRRPTPLAPDTYTLQLLQHVPELTRLARVDVEILFNLDSSNVTPAHWEQIGRCLFDRRDAYDGFVVVHGTDTMAYTASACAFALQGLRKPVVFTGSQRPLGEVRSDARSNLVGSVEMATQDIPEVGIFFDSRLFRGVCTVKSDVWQYDAFHSPNCLPLATVGVDLKVASHVRRPSSPPSWSGGFKEDVVCLELVPGFNPAFLDALVQAGARGVVLRAFGSGNVPSLGREVPEAVQRVVRQGVPVVVVTQVWKGGVDLRLYECGQRVLDAGALDGGDLTTPAAVVKLMWALHQGADAAQVAGLFGRDLCGEGGGGAARMAPGTQA
jgi:L-asparaginase